MSSSPASVIGATRSSMPCASRSNCQGTKLEWCSMLGDHHRLARPQHAAPVAVGDEVDRLGAVAHEHDLGGVGRVDQARGGARASPRRRRWCARSSSAGRDARWRTASPWRPPWPRSPARGFCAQAALSRNTSGLPRTVWREDRETRRGCGRHRAPPRRASKGACHVHAACLSHHRSTAASIIARPASCVIGSSASARKARTSIARASASGMPRQRR